MKVIEVFIGIIFILILPLSEGTVADVAGTVRSDVTALDHSESVGMTSRAGEEINWQVISNGGTDGSSANYGLKGTIGQTATGDGSSDNFGVSHGFWQKFSSGGGPCQGRCADANADGNVNVSDAVYIINYVFITGSPEPTPVKACGDANSDGSVNISDAVNIINYVFITGSLAPSDCSPGSWPGGDCCPF